jgi:hypothetical protein
LSFFYIEKIIISSDTISTNESYYSYCPFFYIEKVIISSEIIFNERKALLLYIISENIHKYNIAFDVIFCQCLDLSDINVMVDIKVYFKVKFLQKFKRISSSIKAKENYLLTINNHVK